MVDEITQLASTITAATKNIKDFSGSDVDAMLSGLMTDASYLRQSSSLINEALQKGFDVLQLPNGDIVTTGTKTIVYQYHWDDTDKKLVEVEMTETVSNEQKTTSATSNAS